MYDVANAVASVDVLGEAGEGEGPLATTTYTVRIVRLLKGADGGLEEGGSMSIRRRGRRTGASEHDATLDDGFRPFEVGERWLLFLSNKWSAPKPDLYAVSFLEAGAFRCNATGAVEPASRHWPLSLRQKGRSCAALEAEITALKKEKHK